ncbi:GGDEF domain-containing protein [archaeon]|jgi:diguanylate cyclase (GGDEF)-like protein|nr:GGDEF domain-containing protein [archaeon]MBT4416668.1 GGDEF domain-containing protein [archaeon]
MSIVDHEKQLVLLTKEQEKFILNYNAKLTIIEQHSHAINRIINLANENIIQPNQKKIHFIKKYIKLIQKRLQPAFFEEFKEEELLHQDQKVTQTLISALDTNKEIIQNHLSELQGYEIAEQLTLLSEDINQERVSLSGDENENQSLEQINKVLKDLIKRFKKKIIEIQELFNLENNLFEKFENKLSSIELLNIIDRLKSTNININELKNELKDEIIRPILGFLITETLITQRVLEIGQRERITIHTLKRDIKTCTTPQEIFTYLDLISEYEELFTNPNNINKFIRQQYKIARKAEKEKTIESMRTKAQLRKEKGILRKFAKIDKLTKVFNRRSFDEAMEKKVAECKRDPKKILTILVIDIDHFKLFNDSYNHTIGDQVLHFVAQTILKEIRTEENVYRYGGEEFTVLFVIGTKMEEGLAGAERIRAAIEEDSKSEMEKINNETQINKIDKITISGGVATLQITNDKIETEEIAKKLFESADEALIQAKAQGRNRILPGETLIISE